LERMDLPSLWLVVLGFGDGMCGGVSWLMGRPVRWAGTRHLSVCYRFLPEWNWCEECTIRKRETDFDSRKGRVLGWFRCLWAVFG
jgi:hypothetical protein